jgi:hypothetical protein
MGALVLAAIVALVDGSPAPVRFAKPRLVAYGFADAPRIPLVADVDGDGFADLIAVDPSGPGTVDVALCVRGGKFAAPEAAARDLGANLVSAATRAGDGGRAEIVVTRADGGRRIVARAANGAWSVRDESPATDVTPPPGSAAHTSEPRRVSGDFDGDGKQDEILLDDATLRLASMPESPIAVPALRDVPASAIVVAGDVSGDRRDDLVIFRRDDGWRVGHDVLACLAYRDDDPDPDGDGLDSATEARLGTDPLDADTDHDGLLDGWEVKGEGALDLPALGASPTHQDCFVYCQRVADADGATCAREIPRAIAYWSRLPVQNPDGQPGIALHAIWLPPIPVAEGGKPWWDQGAANLPPLARGLAHYIVISNGGGGQAGELAEMGGCGVHGLYATFLHEFGHEVGLSHTGGPNATWSPTYSSLMNYAYNYSFEEDGNAIHYSHGELASIVLDETKLPERLPVPFDRLKFLSKAPYRFRTKADGDATLVDWNRDGKFSDGPVRADVTDVYGVDGGNRVTVGKTIFAPALALHGGKLSLFGVNRDKALTRRECLGEERWSDEAIVPGVVPTGDPCAVSAGDELLLFVPTDAGVSVLAGADAASLDGSHATLLPESAGLAVSAATFEGRVLAFLWRDGDHAVRLVERGADGAFGSSRELEWLVSTFPPGAVEDPVAHELVIGSGIVADGGKHAWRVSRVARSADGGLEGRGSRIVGGLASGWCGDSRPVLLFESDGGAGRLHFVARGMGSGKDRNGCFWEAVTIGDASENEGWRLRRYYDEWTTTRSPIAACWHDGDMTLACRWYGNVHGDEDDNLFVAQHGLGIRPGPMTDFDDVTEISAIGLARSIPWRHAAAR